MIKECDSGFQNVVIQNVNDFYVQIFAEIVCIVPQCPYLLSNFMGLDSVVDVALASEAEGCGFDPPTGPQVPTSMWGSPN